jgi:hypothetical protein
VTVEVTNEMLRSLPHGMTNFNSGGIWQPVKLVVTEPVRMSDVYIQPSLKNATAEIALQNGGETAQRVSLTYSIIDAQDSSVLFLSPTAMAVEVPAHGSTTAKIATSTLQPKLWTPADPNLYHLKVTLTEGMKIIDEKTTRFGFRTFAVAGDKLLLNGQPYWLRGGNHFPVTLRPNDVALARRFTQLARDGNVQITRSHAIPFTEQWFEVTDEVGMGVSYEGTWTWLMLEGPLPDANLLKIWKEEFSDLIRQHRNHPSLLFWTINNEMKFPMIETLGDEVLKQKWAVLDDMIRTLRQLDPTRPVVADSAYTRREADRKSKAIREQNNYDDGDMDDVHTYNGWYNESPFHLFDGEFGKTRNTPGRPLISQEISTGYPRNDDWPSRSYEFPRYVPQALVGAYAFEQNDPAIFMTRQAFMTKELGEVIRRTNRDQANGLMHFAYLTWFTNVWKADSIRPKLTYYAVKTALQPVLVSAELYGRHFYAGDTARRRVCLINDSNDNSALGAGELTWEVNVDDRTIARGKQSTPDVAYYSNRWIDVDFALPSQLPQPRVNAKLVLRFTVAGRTVSENNYDIVVATRRWASAPSGAKKPLLFDPHGRAGADLLGLEVERIASPAAFDVSRPLIVGDLAALMASPDGPEKFKIYVETGGRALLLQPGADLVKLFPAQVKSYRKTEGEIVTMQVPESPVFDEIEPLDTAWFERGDRQLPYACTGTYEVDRAQPGVVTLAHQCTLHPAIDKGRFFQVAGAPIVELHAGKGVVIASEMLSATKNLDPIAGRLLANMVAYLGKPVAAP